MVNVAFSKAKVRIGLQPLIVQKHFWTSKWYEELDSNQKNLDIFLKYCHAEYITNI